MPFWQYERGFGHKCPSGPLLDRLGRPTFSALSLRGLPVLPKWQSRAGRALPPDANSAGDRRTCARPDRAPHERFDPLGRHPSSRLYATTAFVLRQQVAHRILQRRFRRAAATSPAPPAIMETRKPRAADGDAGNRFRQESR